MKRLLRRSIPGIIAGSILAVVYAIGASQVAQSDPGAAAERYRFDRLPIAMPPGYEDLPHQTVREVNPDYEHIKSWVSSVGASIAITDLNGSGRDTGLCLVDPRTDSVVVTYTPTATAKDQFTPFVLDPKPLPMSDAIAPMGCVPGDYDSDGRTDLLVYYWGRTPILFMASDTAERPAPASYRPAEAVPTGDTPSYTGQPWNTNAVLVSDLNADTHPDLIVGNYFPDSGVLDTQGREDVYMNDSLSRATNGGGPRVLRWVRNDEDGTPVYVEDRDAVPFDKRTGWTLGIGAGDLTSDGRPEVYLANDFGHDHLLLNVSESDEVSFSSATGSRGPTTPKSFVLGQGSFKGMGVDFVDMYNSGHFDMIVSNITTAWGLEESHFLWRNDSTSATDMRSDLEGGHAPFTQQAQQMGMAWSGWGWDLKGADMLNAGQLDVLQSTGFVKGEHDRWAWLQELATVNDVLVREPGMWPKLEEGADIAGHQPMAFFARSREGELTNITEHIGTDIRTPSRGIALGDTTGAATLDFAVAYQWDEPVFYRNTSPGLGRGVVFRLYRPAEGTPGGMQSLGSPAYNATVEVVQDDGRRMLGQLDGGSGHAGKRSFGVHFGLGNSDGPVRATISWIDSEGQQRSHTLSVEAGVHDFILTEHAEEISR